MNNAKITYRSCNENDLEYLLWLRKETMSSHLEKAGFNLEDEDHLKRIMYEFENANLIFLNQQKIGLLKLVENQNFIEIIQIQIDPNYQRKGIGERVIKTIIESNSSTKKPIILSVLKQNHARKLYEKMGFKIEEENEHSYIMKF